MSYRRRIGDRAYGLVLANSTFLTSQIVAMNIRNQSVGIDCKLSLEKRRQRVLGGSHRTYIKHLKNPIKVPPPSHNIFFITLCMEEPNCPVSFAVLGDLPLYRGYSSVIINEIFGVCILCLTHAVNRPIASSTDVLSSSDFFPFKPRSRALHTSAQNSPRST